MQTPYHLGVCVWLCVAVCGCVWLCVAVWGCTLCEMLVHAQMMKPWSSRYGRVACVSARVCVCVRTCAVYDAYMHTHILYIYIYIYIYMYTFVNICSRTLQHTVTTCNTPQHTALWVWAHSLTVCNNPPINRVTNYQLLKRVTYYWNASQTIETCHEPSTFQHVTNYQSWKRVTNNQLSKHVTNNQLLKRNTNYQLWTIQRVTNRSPSFDTFFSWSLFSFWQSATNNYSMCHEQITVSFLFLSWHVYEIHVHRHIHVKMCARSQNIILLYTAVMHANIYICACAIYMCVYVCMCVYAMHMCVYICICVYVNELYDVHKCWSNAHTHMHTHTHTHM